ncbi:MAG: redoxin domain-containing protein [Pseudomonadota bacterium]
MRNTFAAVAAATVVLGAAGNLEASPEIGVAAPAFSGTTSKGETLSLEEFRGQTVVLEWTNHGCPYVQKHYGTGNMQALQKQATDDGVVWLSVISSRPGSQGYVEGAEADQLTVEREAAPTQVVLDPEGDIGRLYGATNTPHMYIVDAGGMLVYKGGIDDKPSARWSDVETAHNYVGAALGELAAGGVISEPVTRAYGCSVKYAPTS